jgi:CRP-like cAMP-binding protein
MAEITDLRQHEVFGVFPDIQLSKLAGITKKKVYRRDEPIYKRGDSAKNLFLVRQGLVGLHDTEPGDLEGICVETCGPGQVFGIASLMRPYKHLLTAVCMEDSEVLAIEAKPLLRLCEEEPRLGNWFMMTIAHLYFRRYDHYSKDLFGPIKASTSLTPLQW